MRFTPLIILLSCRVSNDPIKTNPVDTGAVTLEDLDGDGFFSDEDCDDNDAQINPSVDELCDGFDNDCDGEVDEGVLLTFYFDNDEDGFGNIDDTTEACEVPDGYTPNGNDCDDMDATAYPSAPEQCDDIDNDCDGVVDEDLQREWWIDEDGDGFGDPEYYAEGCLAEDGFAANSDDCDDFDAEVNPDMEEVCDEIDNNCDGEIDEDLTITVYLDADMDGYGDDSQFLEVCELTPGYATIGGDCDDIDSSAYPGGTEICDDVDNNCDGQIDEGVGSTGTYWYYDGDSDGYGDSTISEIGCTPSPGYVSLDGDCDDADSVNFPGNTEICDGQDNNCDTLVDDDDSSIVGQFTWYEDQDSDGMGSSVTQLACVQPAGYVAGTGDCDDSNAVIYDAAPEMCDTYDNDCDGLIDDLDPDIQGQSTWYQDGDGDGNGSSISQVTCFVPAGYVPTTGDCDDTNTSIYDGAPELCDTLDNNCSGLTDDADPLVVGQGSYYNDGDGDGVGTGAEILSCIQPSGTAAIDGDCNDGDANIKPGVVEVCDSIDNDCDGDIDDADSGVVGQSTFYQDADADGFGGSNTSTVCYQPQSYTTNTGDCDDSSAGINPSATEVCDSVDNDCDGAIDDADGSVVGQTVWYQDNDGDGYGSSSSMSACSQPGGYTNSTNDCNDGDGGINPGASETCVNGVDEDCDGSYNEGCSVQLLDCGGPGSLQPGRSVGCSFSTRVVTGIRIRGGCNDGETGNYTITFSDGTSVNFSAGCGTTYSVSDKVTSSATLYMNSGGGGDNNISWTCCGSSGHDVYYR